MRKREAGYQRRTVPFDVRVDGDGQDTKITGHAAVFDSLSEEMGFFWSYREKIARGAFDDAIARVERGEDDVYALLNHDSSLIIGGTRNGTLRLSVDEKGLMTETKPLDTQTIRDLVLAPMRAGLLRKMSFGFQIADDHEEKRDGENIVVIDKVSRLFDISPVTFPAYPTTDVEARGIFAVLGIDPEKLSGTERLAARSFLQTFARHLAPLAHRAADECARVNCGHARSNHPDDGACDQDDGCDSYVAPAEAASRVLPARSAQAGARRDDVVTAAGADVDFLRRRLELEMLSFEFTSN